jgi:hypothetical protein
VASLFLVVGLVLASIFHALAADRWAASGDGRTIYNVRTGQVIETRTGAVAIERPWLDAPIVKPAHDGPIL